MNFTRAKPGSWALFEILTSGQMNLIDQQLEFALDGANGGTYSPASSLTWRNKWVIDTTVGAPPPAGAALSIDCDIGRDALETQGGDSGGAGAILRGGTLGEGANAVGGDSSTDGFAGEGVIAQGGLNTFAGLTGFGGYGVLATAGAGANGGIALAGVGGAANLAGGEGGAGAIVFGGTGNGTGNGGRGVAAIGGSSPGTGVGGLGVDALGGPGTGGATDGAGGQLVGGGVDGMGLIAIGAGGTAPTHSDRAGAIVVAGSGTADGLVATASGNGYGVTGNATGLGAAIQANQYGVGPALRGFAQNGGYAVEAIGATNAPLVAPFRVQPQNALPTATDVGALTVIDRMHVYQTYAIPGWQAVTTNLTSESVKAFAHVTQTAGVVAIDKAYNIAGAAIQAGNTKIRFTFFIGFTQPNGHDYTPQVLLNCFGLNYGLIPQIIAKTNTYFEIGLWDTTAGAFADLTLAGSNVVYNVTVAGGF